MTRSFKIIALAAALAVMLCGCSAVFAENGGKTAPDKVTPENFDYRAFLDEDMLSHLKERELTELERAQGVVAGLDATDDRYPDVDVYVFRNPRRSMADFASMEAAVDNAVAGETDNFLGAAGPGYVIVAHEIYDGVDYYTITVMSESDGYIYEYVFYTRPERIRIGDSSRSFCLPVTLRAVEPFEDYETARYKVPDEYKDVPGVGGISLYSADKKDFGYHKFLVAVSKADNLDINHATRSGKEYITYLDSNADGTFDIGFAFEENDKVYAICMHSTHENEPHLYAVTNSLL